MLPSREVSVSTAPATDRGARALLLAAFGRLQLCCFGNRLLTVLLVFLGLGPALVARAQSAMFMGALVQPCSSSCPIGSGLPQGVAHDLQGNLWVSTQFGTGLTEILAVNGVLPVPPATSSGGTVASGDFLNAAGLAVDSAGDVWVADAGANAILEVVAVNGAIPSNPTVNTIISTGLNHPWGLAFDALGNLWFSDRGNGAIKEALAVSGMVPANPTVNVVSNNFELPEGVWVDAHGNVFVADPDGLGIYEMPGVAPPAASTPPANPTINLIATGFAFPDSVAVDSQGNAWVGDNGTGYFNEVVAVNGSIPANPVIIPFATWPTSPSGQEPIAITIDGQGNIVMAEWLGSTEGIVSELTPAGYYGQVQAGAGTASSTLPTSNANVGLLFGFTASTTINAPAVYTQGFTGLDFTDLKSGTCTADGTSHQWLAGTYCTVAVQFKPLYPGTRLGAVQLTSGSSVLSTAVLSGDGVAPMINFGTIKSGSSYPSFRPQAAASFSFQNPENIAVDPNHNIYIADRNGCCIYEATAASNYQTINPVISTVNYPMTLGFDGAGDLIWDDRGSGQILEAVATNGSLGNSPPIVTLLGGITAPDATIIDTSGDVFFADEGYRGVRELVAVNGKIPANPTIRNIESTILTGTLAFDQYGNLFLTSSNPGCLYEISPVGGQIPTNATPQQIVCGLGIPEGLAVDAAGNIWESDFYNGLVEVQASNGAVSSSSTLLTWSGGSGFGLGLDEDGSVFTSLYPDVLEFDFSDPPTFTWSGTTNTGDTNPTTYTAFATDAGNEPITILIPSSGTNPSINPNWTWATTGANACPSIPNTAPITGFGTIGLNQTCDLTISFSPVSGGSLTGQLTFTDNNLNDVVNTSARVNAGDPTQSITLNGTAVGGAVPTASLAPNPLAFGSEVSGQTSAAMIATLTNNSSTIALTGITASITGTNPSDFAITTGTNACGATLAASSTCSIYVTFTPASATSFSATLSVADNASNSPQTASLTGTGTASSAPMASLSPALLAFPAVTVEQGYDSGSGGIPAITLTNTGTAPLAFTGSKPFTTIGPANSPFAVYPNGSCSETYLDFSLPLPAGDSCTITVQFFPGKAGVFAATLSVADNASNTPQTSLVTGIGAAGQLQFIPDQLNIIAGTYGTPGDSGDGAPASSALVSGGYGAAVDNQGNFYFSDYDYNTVRKIDTSGNITTFAGAPVLNPGHGSYSGDNGPATSATLNGPNQIAVDGFGNVYIADSGNNLIRMVNTAGTITTFAGSYGNGSPDYGGDNGPATSAKMNYPTGVAVDALDNVYIVDSLNYIVRVVDPSGTISLFAGIPGESGYSGDAGPATAAKLNSPMQAATDLAGNVYIGDPVSRVVRKVDTGGTITTYAGGGSSAVTTTPQLATSALIEVDGLATDPAGNLYIDIGSNELAVVNTSQQISLIAGGGTSTVSGIPATAAAIDAEGIAVDASGDLFINDPSNHVIDEIGPQGDLVFGSQSVGTTSAALPLTLTNTGNAAVSFYNPNDAGVDPINARSAKANAKGPAPYGTTSFGGGVGLITGDFAIASGGTCNLSDGIASGASCTLNVTFSPTATGARTGTITLYTDEPYESYTATVQLSGTGAAASLTPQTITFTQPTTPETYAAGLTIPLVATGGASGNPVVFTIDASSTATGSISGSTLTVASVGSFVIDANQAGNSTYAAAPQVQKTVVVNQASQAINFTQPTSPVTYSGSSLTVPLSATGGASGNPVVFSIDSSSTATGSISGSTLTVTSTGNLVIDANQAGNADYSAAPQVQRTITVNAPAPDFSVAATPPSQTVQPGASATYPVTVADVGSSFTSAVTLSVSGLPTGATGTFNPPTVTPDSESGSSTLTVTTAASAGLVRPNLWPIGTPVLALLFMLPFRRWRKLWRGKLLLVVAGLISLAGALSLMGCGGGFGLKTSQTYTLTITGTSGTDTHSTTVQLTVEQ